MPDTTKTATTLATEAIGAPEETPVTAIGATAIEVTAIMTRIVVRADRRTAPRIMARIVVRADPIMAPRIMVIGVTAIIVTAIGEIAKTDVATITGTLMGAGRTGLLLTERIVVLADPIMDRR